MAVVEFENPMKYLFNPMVVLRRGCPRCGHAMFKSPLVMYDDCPGCGLRFDRGQAGYFMGALYFSYGGGIPLFTLLTLIGHLLFPSWSLFRLMVVNCAVCLPMVPWIWQYSRVLWVHFERTIDRSPSDHDDDEPHTLTED